ncbi:MAG: hypothetical protein SPL99_07870 [Catonella sp.]|jgi:flagellar basal body-associated protein FliL|nr:hypothetical protein [Catonella sp.]MDY6356732.1 hypothetical protein [Catonella sp.]
MSEEQNLTNRQKKKEKLKSYKKRKRIRNTAIAIVIIAAILGAMFGGYYYGHKKGYDKGYEEGALAMQNYMNAIASSSAINASPSAVDEGTVSGSAETASGSSVSN